MICVRCLNDTAGKIADAPDGSNAWEVYYCEKCNYSWRSSEEESITVVEKRDPEFQFSEADFAGFITLNVIPPLSKA